MGKVLLGPGIEMAGASSSQAGNYGLVPIPLAGDEDKYLKGNGSWGNVGAKVITVESSISNTSGSFATSITDSRVNSTMKAVSLEVGTPTTFNAPIDVTCNSGSVLVECSDMAGTSTIKISIMKLEEESATITSYEYDVLNAAKANKASNPTAGHLATLDASGNVTDSGHSATEYYIKPSNGIPRTDMASGLVLPEVSSSDNGKFLTVSNGAWAATTMQAWQGGSY